MLKRRKVKPPSKVEYTKEGESKFRKRTRLGMFGLQVIGGGAILLVMGWWGYTQVMRQVLGHFEFFNWEKASLHPFPA